MLELTKVTGWAIGKLADVANVVSGGTPSRSIPEYWSPDIIPWATPTDITRCHSVYLTETAEAISEKGLKHSSANLLPAGSVLMTSRATLGSSKIALRPTCTNQGFKSLVPKAENSGLFLKYWMEFTKSHYANLGTGTTFMEVNKRDTENFPVYLIPEVEQKRIAEVLVTVDEQIEITLAQLDKIRILKRAIYKDFLDEIENEAAQVELSSLSSFITSGPRGWAQFYTLNDTFPAFLRIGNLTREHINFRASELIRVAPPLGHEGGRTLLKKDDILISITADLGVIACVDENFEGSYINQHIAMVRLDPAKVNPRFIAHQLWGSEGQNQFKALNDSGAKAGLNLPTIGRLKVWVPKRARQDYISETLDGLDTNISEVEREMRKLKSLKASLVSDLLTGKTRVPC